MLRMATIALIFILSAGISQACSKRAGIDFADFLGADVVIEARVVRYIVDRANNAAVLNLETIRTYQGFEKANWTVELRPSTDKIPEDSRWIGPVLVPLRGIILKTGAFSAAVVDKPCGPIALLPTDSDPGRLIKTQLMKITQP